MSVHPAQTIAADMTLIVVAILAATLIVIVPTWKRFIGYWNDKSPRPWRRIMLGSSFLAAPPVLLILAGLVSLWISTDTWHYKFRYVVILMILGLSLPVYFYVIPRWFFREMIYTWAISAKAYRFGSALPFGSVRIYIFVLFRRSWRGLRRRGGSKNRNAPNLSKEIGALAALACFVETILLTLVIAMAAIPIAIGVDLGGQPPEENFEFARAMMIVMPTVFVCGLGCLGFSYFAELERGVPSSKE